MARADESLFWADQHARTVIQTHGDKETYVIAAGITPSGTVHIGNFREIITVDLVRRSLETIGKKVRFIYSWDDFDHLRKVPSNIPPEKRAEMASHIGRPVSAIPDPWSCHGSYARHFEEPLEHDLKELGITPEYLYQHLLFKKCVYAEGIRTAMRRRKDISRILNRFRREPLPKNWYPLRIYCESCGKSTQITISDYDENYTVSYACACGHTSTIDFHRKGVVKPPWRVDWPMRWDYYKEDFEPAGRDHMSPGSSYDTGILIQKEIYGTTPPYGFMYNFISLKGTGGKMSGSRGNVVSIREVMNIYLPEIVRFLFAGTRPGKEFAISFDEDVLKVYEDFYRTERIYFGTEQAGEKARAQHRRIYEMSAIRLPSSLPVQPGFRHAVTLMNIFGDVRKALERATAMDRIKKTDRKRYEMILGRAGHWIRHYAPESYRFTLHDRLPAAVLARLSAPQREAVRSLARQMDELTTEDQLIDAFRACAQSAGISTAEFFTAMYLLLIGKETGPRLAPFILSVGKEKVRDLLSGLLS